MPRIETTGVFPDDTNLLLAVMHWPGADAGDIRRGFTAVEYADGRFGDGHPNVPVFVNASLIQALIDAPSQRDLRAEMKKRIKRATFAGYVFIFMFLMEHCRDLLPKRGKKGASTKKALYLAEQWARSAVRFGDGDKMPSSRKTIQDCWSEFRSVSHLWAAIELNKSLPFSPAGEVLHPDHFHKFMEVASFFQDFGQSLALDTKSKQGRAVLLPPEEIWEVDPVRFRPRNIFPEDKSVFSDSPIMMMLRNYRAAI